MATLVLAACAAPAGPDPDLRPRGGAEFTVPRASGVLALYGDSRPRIAGELWRGDPGAAHEQVVERLAADRPDLVLHDGDLVASGDDDASWALAERALAPLRARKVPVFLALGNHEYHGDRERALGTIFAHFPDLQRNRWYSVRHDSLLAIVLDTNAGALGEQGCLDQATWLAATLAKADADPTVTTVIAVTHQPPFTNAALHSGSAFVRTTILPVLARHEKVAALFSGHTHAYERFSSHGMHCVVTGGGGAPLMSVIRTSPVSAPDRYDGPRAFHYCRITSGPEARCEVVMLVADGTWKVVDSFALRRNPD